MTFNALTSCFEFSTVLLSVSPIFIFMHMKWENKFFGFTKKQILMFSAATISLLCLVWSFCTITEINLHQRCGY